MKSRVVRSKKEKPLFQLSQLRDSFLSCHKERSVNATLRFRETDFLLFIFVTFTAITDSRLYDCEQLGTRVVIKLGGRSTELFPVARKNSPRPLTCLRSESASLTHNEPVTVFPTPRAPGAHNTRRHRRGYDMRIYVLHVLGAYRHLSLSASATRWRIHKD